MVFNLVVSKNAFLNSAIFRSYPVHILFILFILFIPKYEGLQSKRSMRVCKAKEVWGFAKQKKYEGLQSKRSMRGSMKGKEARPCLKR